jgi:two-component system, OmpR family, KDP operon response regulator KdpE
MSEPHGKVLIVEDDTSLCHALRTTLTALGFDTGEAGTGEDALTRLTGSEFEVVLLDMNMPGMGGIEACKRIRSSYTRLPILMLTVRDGEDDKVQALDSGADDYITKPFQMRELTARIRSAVRRYRAPQSPAPNQIKVGAIKLDLARRRVEKAGVPVHLTPREFNVLKLLMENAGMPLSHATLLQTLRGEEQSQNREYLRVMMNNLRKKLEKDPANPVYVLTESCIGYRFKEN